MSVRPSLAAAAIALSLTSAAAAAATPPEPQELQQHAGAIVSPLSLNDAIRGEWRTPANVARDRYRHPAQTLAFFQLAPSQTVIEITPGGGWYSEILAPYLRDKGHYVAAVGDPAAAPEGKSRDYVQKTKSALEAKFAAAPAQYDRAEVVAFDPKAPTFGAPGSADLVLTFRNVHNWRVADQAEGMFKGFFAVLKPGGVLGVVEHRAKGDVAADDESGYVGEQQVIAMAEAAGFKLDEKSEINANPKDTKDYPGGVWTLPPTNDHDAKDNAKYQAIGESDRMTLRFVKVG